MKFINNQAFKGLYKRKLVAFDGDAEGWSCSFILNGEQVETDYCNNPKEALKFAELIIKEKEGK